MDSSSFPLPTGLGCLLGGYSSVVMPPAWGNGGDNKHQHSNYPRPPLLVGASSSSSGSSVVMMPRAQSGPDSQPAPPVLVGVLPSPSSQCGKGSSFPAHHATTRPFSSPIQDDETSMMDSASFFSQTTTSPFSSSFSSSSSSSSCFSPRSSSISPMSALPPSYHYSGTDSFYSYDDESDFISVPKSSCSVSPPPGSGPTSPRPPPPAADVPIFTSYSDLFVGKAASLGEWLAMGDVLNMSVTSRRHLCIPLLAPPSDNLVLRKPTTSALRCEADDTDGDDVQEKQSTVAATAVQTSRGLLERVAVPGIVVADGRTIKPVLEALNSGVWPCLTSLSLASVGMTDEGLTTLTEVMAKGAVPSLLVLNLSGGRFTDNGISRLATDALGLGACPFLNDLDLGANGFGQADGLRALTTALEKRGGCDSIKRLVLGSWQWGRRPQPGVLHRLLSLPVMADVEELVLHDVSLMTCELKAIAEYLSHSRPLRLRVIRLSCMEEDQGLGAGYLLMAFRNGAATNLEVLSLSHAKIGNGSKARDVLVDALVGGACWKLQELWLSNADLSSEDLCYLMPAIVSAGAGVRGGLRVLMLDGSPDITEEGAIVMAKVFLSSPCPCLQVLGLNGSTIGDVGIQALILAMEHGAPIGRSVTTLHLSNCSLGAKGLLSLGLAMTRGVCPRIEELYVAFNGGIGDGGVMALAHVMMLHAGHNSIINHSSSSHHVGLKVLDVRCINMSEGGILGLAMALEAGACPSLIRLDMMQAPRFSDANMSRAMDKVRQIIATRRSSGGKELA